MPGFSPSSFNLSLLLLALQRERDSKSADSVLFPYEPVSHLWEFTQRVILTLDGVSLMANVVAKHYSTQQNGILQVFFYFKYPYMGCIQSRQYLYGETFLKGEPCWIETGGG